MRIQFNLFFFLAILCTHLTAAAQQLPGDNRWSDSFGGHIEFNEKIWKVETSADKIYVSGEFTRVGGELARGFAMWDGETWAPMLGGPCMLRNLADTEPYCEFDFHQFAVAGDYVYAGARLWDPVASAFTPALVQWDGQTWSVYFEFDNSRDLVTSMVIEGDPAQGTEVLYAAGIFAGSQQVVRFEGQNWESLGAVDTFVYRMGMAEGNLYIAGGGLGEIGGVVVNKIAQWDGSQWKDLGVQFTGRGIPSVDDLFVEGGNVYFAGNIGGLNGDLTPLSVIMWDGQQWETFTNAFTEGEILGTGKRVVAIGSELYIAGGFFSNREAVEDSESGVVRMVSWDGVSTELVSVKGLIKESIQDLAVFGDKIVVAEEERVSILDRNFMTPIDNVNQGMNGSVVRLAADDEYLYAGGDFTTVNGIFSSFMARWDGQTWHGYENAFNGQVKNLEVVDGVVYAAGAFRAYPYLTEINGEPVTPIAMLKNDVWQPFPYRFRRNADDLEGSASIWNLKRIGDDLFVLGGYTLIDDLEAPGGIARWDGESWTTYPSAYSLDLLVFDVAIFEGELYAAGLFETGTQAPGTAIVKWDGTDWVAVGNDTFPSGTIHKLLTDGDTLYAVGQSLYELKDDEWEMLGNGGITWGLNFQKGGAVLQDSSIYIGGPIHLDNFIEIQENCALSIAYVGQWQSGSFSPLGSATKQCGVTEYFAHDWGAIDWVNDIEVFDGQLYVAGDFTYAGGKPANYISSWNLAPSITSIDDDDGSVSGFVLSPPYPNPFSATLSLSFNVTEPQYVVIDVYDALGKRMDRLMDGYKAAGTHHIQWVPEGMPAGIYFMAVQTENTKQIQKVVYVK